MHISGSLFSKKQLGQLWIIFRQIFLLHERYVESKPEKAVLNAVNYAFPSGKNSDLQTIQGTRIGENHETM